MELFLKWKTDGDHPEAKTWLKKNMFSTRPMKNGLLVMADRDQIEKTFSVSLEERELPFELPIPKELLPFVASITVPKPRTYHS